MRFGWAILLVLFASLHLGGCGSLVGEERLQCTKDSDCPSGNTCQINQCGPAADADGGVVADAGGIIDDAGGPLVDSGTPLPPDAGSDLEAGSPADAGGGVDAGQSPDAGALIDAGAAIDAGALPDSGPLADAGQGTSFDASVIVDAGSPAKDDAGPGIVVFPYDPVSFPQALGPDPRISTVVNCTEAVIDSQNLQINLCQGWENDPSYAEVVSPPGGGPQVYAVHLRTLSLQPGAILRIKGNKPAVLVVWGDANIQGTINASSQRIGGDNGAGSQWDGCTGQGNGGVGITSQQGGVGGGGAGFGTQGGLGGHNGDADGPGPRGTASAQQRGVLRGGCKGGDGGLGGITGNGGAGGSGGGAFHLAVAEVLNLNNAVFSASGAGGTGGSFDFNAAGGGGGGGGSGGSLWVTAGNLNYEGNTIFAVSGGGGGEGADLNFNGAHGGDGKQDSGTLGSGGGSGMTNDGGGGGGGGGAGRVFIQGIDACASGGTLEVGAQLNINYIQDCP
jgi:hypothetical protein